MTHVHIRPELLYAWNGQSLLVVSNRGDTGEQQPLCGFYFRETRHLSRLRLLINGESPWLCAATSEAPSALRFDYVHPELYEFGGGGSGISGDEVPTDSHGLPVRALDVQLRYEVGIGGLNVALTVGNRSPGAVSFEVQWELDADFADLLEAQEDTRRQEADVACDSDSCLLRFRYMHPELHYDACIAAADNRPWKRTRSGLASAVTLARQESVFLSLYLKPHDYAETLSADGLIERERMRQRWQERFTTVTTPGNQLVEAILRNNLREFASFPLLDGARDEWLALQAGIPLYPALFARDAITAGWHAASVDRGETLDASLTRIGRLQSSRTYDWTDEEPGRIPFQIRQGPLARLGVNPFAAYYADFASPFMFVIGLAHLYSWTGDQKSLERHWDVARRILDWAREFGDRDGDGYVEYLTRSPDGTMNQGWKDSGGSIMYEDGSPLVAPIGTCELQGYWYAAQQLFAVLSWVRGEEEDARAYWHSAAELKKRFNRDWWVDADHCVAFALDGEKRFVPAVTSNAGHCLASGIVSDDHLPALAERLFEPDIFSGWGIRTLSTAHPAYNPIAYHLGSVWAVENATIVFGLRRFGFDYLAVELSRALFDLATLYPGLIVPECVGGYARSDRSSPGLYPRANTTQCWNASGFSLVLHSLLGLQPVAPLDLLVVDPVLPTWLPEVTLRELRVGGATATLRFWRDEDGVSHAEVLRQRGKLRVVKQPPPESLTVGVVDRLGAFVDGLWHR